MSKAYQVIKGGQERQERRERQEHQEHQEHQAMMGNQDKIAILETQDNQGLPSQVMNALAPLIIIQSLHKGS